MATGHLVHLIIDPEILANYQQAIKYDVHGKDSEFERRVFIINYSLLIITGIIKYGGLRVKESEDE